ncbi:FOG: Ankyrin repeat [Ceraceosorus bombacis]|uniref:FOG: Ankyrin repeat n=1 Tax=Ceraceosorus bombacis TaxID=401625 RepID=A0A0P1B953_9BASI|nr:FOG: Ankyrin repeat [Ceraceosorus bombacis]
MSFFSKTLSKGTSEGQSEEAAAFLARFATINFPPEATAQPRDDVDSALSPSLKHEEDLRRVWAQARTSLEIKALAPCVGLVDVHGEATADANGSIFKTRRRLVEADASGQQPKIVAIPGGPRTNPTRTDAQHVLPLPESDRRPHGSPAVASQDEFREAFNILTENAFALLHEKDWQGVLVAGGSVLAALTPLPQKCKKSRRELRRYLHESGPCRGSDIDVFLYGMADDETAKAKIARIAQLIADAIPWDITCIRSKHAITLVSQYPHRHVQFVLRLYSSPAEILMGFDVDSSAVGFDGKRVLAAPRALISLITQSNTVDMTRRSPSYEVRLTKYAERGFEIYVPHLRRADIDPSIYERTPLGIKGLALLLVLEKMRSQNDRDAFLDQRRKDRSRPELSWQQKWSRQRNTLSGDLKTGTERGQWLASLATSNYDAPSTAFHLPYGPRWQAARIEKLLYRTDVVLNAAWNEKNKALLGLHRHPAFFGTIEECMEDCCKLCPEPQSSEQKELFEERCKDYVRGRVEFIKEEPGRQLMSGSFQPLTDDDWTTQAYMTSAQMMMKAVLDGNLECIHRLCLGGEDTARKVLLSRDQSGRTPLHLAILERKTKVAVTLVSLGARVTSRLADGRSAFILAAEQGNATVVQSMLMRSNANEAAALEKDATRKERTPSASDGVTRIVKKQSEEGGADDEASDDGNRHSANEDQDSEDDEAVLVKRPNKSRNEEAQQEGIPPEVETPDVIALEDYAWDSGLPALHYAVTSGDPETVKILLDAGASPNMAVAGVHPLMAAVLIPEDEAAIAVIKVLLAAGSSSSRMTLHKARHNQVKSTMLAFTAFVLAGRQRLVAALLELDAQRAEFAATFALFQGRSYSDFAVTSSLSLALLTGQLGTAALLLAAGAKAHITGEQYGAGRNCSLVRKDNYNYVQASSLVTTIQPLAASLLQANLGFYLLLAADEDLPITALPHMMQLGITKIDEETDQTVKPLSILDELVSLIPPGEDERNAVPNAETIEGQPQNLYEFALRSAQDKARLLSPKNQTPSNHRAPLLTFVAEARRAVLQRGAKPWSGLVFEPPLKDEVQSQYMRGRRRLFYNSADASKKVVEDLLSSAGSLGESQIQFYLLNGGTSYTMQRLAQPVAVSQIDTCRRLFDAVVRGENETVTKLLQREVPAAICYGLRGPSTKQTLLDVAVGCNRWQVAETILHISAQQFKRSEQPKTSFSMGYNYDDSDDESNLDIVEDEPRKQLDQVDEDAAKLPQKTLESLTAPTDLVDNIDWIPAVKRAIEKDPESTDRICEMVTAVSASTNDPFLKSSGTGLVLGLTLALLCDKPKLFQHYLVHAGCSFEQMRVLLRTTRSSQTAASAELESDEEEEGDEILLAQSAHSYYPGLLVHGRRKRDWAREGPTRSSIGNAALLPSRLLELASRYQAQDCIRWLAQDNYSNVRCLLSARIEAIKNDLNEGLADGDAQRKLHTELRSLAQFDLESEQHLALIIGATADDVDKHLSPIGSAASHIRPGRRLDTFELLHQLFPSFTSSWVESPLRGDVDAKFAPYFYVLREFLRKTEVSEEDVRRFKNELKWLVKHGTDPLAMDDEGLNALHTLVRTAIPAIGLQAFAAMQDALGRDVICHLVSQSPLSGPRRGSTPLHELLSSKHLAELQDDQNINSSGAAKDGLAAELLALPDEAVARALKTRDVAGCTPLALAINNVHAVGTRILLSKCKSLDLLDLLRWEDVVGDLPGEKLRRNMIQRSVNHETTDRTIPRWPEVCDLRNGVLSWKEYQERLAARGKEALHRNIPGQIADLKSALALSPTMSPELSSACREIINKLEDQLQQFGSAEADLKDFDGVPGLDIVNLVLQHTPKDSPRILIPASEVQYATKALLDKSDRRYKVSASDERDQTQS